MADGTKDRRALKTYFGYSDAADEPNLGELFYETVDFADLKLGSSENGHFIVAGPKGSGKTAICRYIGERSPHALLWRADNQLPFLNVHAKDLGGYPSEIEAVLLNLILSELTKRIITRSEGLPQGGVNLAKELLPQLADHFKALIRATKVKVKGFEWDLEKILESGKVKFTQFSVDRYIAPLRKCFEKTPALILFDDIDDIFLGADTEVYRVFVEGLIRAAKTINLRFGRHIHFLVFLKYGVFRSFYEEPHDYDKLKQYILVLQWNEQELERMLAKRVASHFGLLLDDEPWKICAKVFRPATKQGVEAIRRYLFERCSSGPRDVIDFCNKAVFRAGIPEITLATLKHCETEFSREKLIQIHQDFGDTYPRLHKLIEKCFEGIQSSIGAKEFRDFVATKVLGKEKVATAFQKERYFETANVNQIIQILYTVGFLGYVLGGGKAPTFVLEDPGGEDLLDADSYVIHTAYRKALRIPQ
jgi:hypothetical protein